MQLDYFNRCKTRASSWKNSERLALIQAQVKALVATVDGRDLPDEELLSEVANLVEAPTSLMGSFDPGLPAPAAGGAHLGDEKAPALFPGLPIRYLPMLDVLRISPN